MSASLIANTTALGHQPKTAPTTVKKRPKALPPASVKAANAPAPKKTATTKPVPAFSRLRLLFILALVILIIKLTLFNFYLNSNDKPINVLPLEQEAEASTTTVMDSAVMTSQTASLALPHMAGSLPNVMTSGASLIFAAAAEVQVAQQTIPLAPNDEDLRKPVVNVTPPTPGVASVPVPPSAQEQRNKESEELARREFELTRRESQLSTREEAIRNLESDVNLRIQDADKSKSEIDSLISRNQAVLDELKALREEQKKDEDIQKDARVEHLVAAFKAMKPEQAGSLINSMDDDVAVAILSAIPGSNAGKILAMVQPDKAARLIKAISQQRIDPKVLLETGNMNLPAS